MDISRISDIYSNPEISASKVDNSKDDKELMDACTEFESYFISMVLKEMRKTVNYSDGYIKRSRGEELFTSLLDDEIGKNAASGNNGMGLAQVLYEQMKKKS